MSGQYVRYPKHVRVCYLLLGWWYLALAAFLYKETGKPRKKETIMSKLKQSLAIGSAAALVAAGFGATAPAYAAGEVTLAPTSGTNLSVFNTDEFSLTTSVVTASVSSTNLSYAITDADQGKWYVKIGSLNDLSGTTDDGSVTLKGRDALGNVVADLDPDTNGDQGELTLAIFSDGATPAYGDGEAEKFGEFLLDFDLMGVTTVYITSIDLHGASNELTLSPFEGTVNADGYEVLTQADGEDGPVGNTDELDHGDLGATAKVQSWIEINGNYTTIDALYASAATTVNWVDPKGVAVIPRVERFIDSSGTAYLNTDNNSNQNLGISIQFATSGLNLDQVDITKWNYNVTEASGTSIKATADFTDGMLKVRSGLVERDDAGRLYAVVAVGANLDKTKTYKMVVDHDGATTVDFGSVAVSLPTSAEEYHIEATVDQSTTNAKQTDHEDTSIELRPGVNTFKYTAQIKTDNTTVAKTASVPVMAIVKASASYVSGTISVTGTSETITSKSGYVMVNGFTNSDGKWDVSVTSSSALKNVAYTISFYVVDASSDDTQAAWVATDVASSNDAIHTATYTAAAATTLTADNDVLSGENITVTFTAKDTYGVATAVNGTKALSVELKSSNGTSYDKDAVVAADGTASFTFANYLGAGASDVLTATLYTGTSTSPTSVTTAVVTLYNAPAVSALQVPAAATGNITYDDFITGKATTAAPAPNDGAITITGTAVDANGAGIPGAVVTVASEGMQFVQNGGTTYAIGSINVVANAAGVFVVDAYAHKVNTTGTAITFTSGGKTATTTVKTYLPASGVDGNNLVFKLNMPANVVMNTTYAVVAELTDKWGNPIQTSARSSVNALSIQGVGSVQINSTDAAVTKNFGKDGKTTVFLRSVKDIAGPGSVTATLQVANYSATSAATATALTITEITTDVKTTAHNETSFANEISADVEVLETAPAASATGKVNVGSFNGKLVVYAAGLDGAKISWKVAGRWGVAVASGNYDIFDRPVGAAGRNVNVEIYVNGVKQLTKTVLTR
jgi:hypothetical protein